jgi:hypothetical protein
VNGCSKNHRRLAPLLTAAAIALAGCGATPPQAPLAEAMKLDATTSDISTACGLSYQVTAFPGDHRADLANLESIASSSARKLASVYARNPAWIYQGETVRQIVRDAVSMLDTCGLGQAARTLLHATARSGGRA